MVTTLPSVDMTVTKMAQVDTGESFYAFLCITFVKFCIGHNFLTNKRKFINVYIFRNEFHENYNGDLDFLPKITVFEKTTKNMFCFAIILF